MKKFENLIGSPDRLGEGEFELLTAGEIIEENKPPPTSVTEEQLEPNKIEEVLSAASNVDD